MEAFRGIMWGTGAGLIAWWVLLSWLPWSWIAGVVGGAVLIAAGLMEAINNSLDRHYQSAAALLHPDNVVHADFRSKQ